MNSQIENTTPTIFIRVPLQVNKFNAVSAFIYKIPRIFTISPPVYGTSSWNIDNSPLNISSSGVYTITPSSAFEVNVKMWGAGGAGVPSTISNAGKGGAGGYASGRYTTGKLSSYVLVVGQGGWNQISNVNNIYTIGGGGGTRISSPCLYGGGMSALFIGSQTQQNAVLIAGGGGAGQTYLGSSPWAGGAGGGSDGERGHGYDIDTGQSVYNFFGYSGSQTRGGLAALTDAYSGSGLLGGHGSNGNGGGACGGGGGYYGGGGSGGTPTVEPGHGVAGSAGGGSGYINTAIVSVYSSIAGIGIVPGNSSDADRFLSGNGGTTASFSSGSDGRVIIY